MRPLHPLPSDNPVQVGVKLRSSRRAQGLTIEQVAEATGLTKGFLSRVERDETSPSVATLLTICQVLSVPIGALFDEPEHEVVSLATAPLINMGGTGAVERLLTPRSESRVQCLRSVLSPGSSGGAQLYTINCQVEIVHVLRGRLDLRFAASVLHLVEGDAVTFAGAEPHSWQNPGRAEADVVWTIVPAAWSGSI